MPGFYLVKVLISLIELDLIRVLMARESMLQCWWTFPKMRTCRLWMHIWYPLDVGGCGLWIVVNDTAHRATIALMCRKSAWAAVGINGASIEHDPNVQQWSSNQVCWMISSFFGSWACFRMITYYSLGEVPMWLSFIEHHLGFLYPALLFPFIVDLAGWINYSCVHNQPLG